MASKANINKVKKAIERRIDSGMWYEYDLRVKLSSGKVLYTNIDDPKLPFHFYTKRDDERRRYVYVSEDAWKEMDQEEVISCAIDRINSETYDEYAEEESFL